MKITIEKFQELYDISQREGTELEKSTLLVQCLTGKTEEEVNKMPVFKFNKLCRKINSAFTQFTTSMDLKKPKNIVKANGRYYWLNYEMAKPPMNAGKYIEIATFSSDIIGNLHRIMATISTPMHFSWKGLVLTEGEKDHEKISEDMLHLDFGIAYHSCLFFYAVSSKSIQNSSTYFKSISTNKIQMEEVLTNLSEVLDGYITAKWYRNLKVSV